MYRKLERQTALSYVYESLRQGSLVDFNKAIARADFDGAWQIALHLALSHPDKKVVENVIYAHLSIPHQGLVRGLLESITVLLRFGHRINRSALAVALASVDNALLQDELVREQLEELDGWLKELGLAE
jgi:hypothetical protein